MKELLVSIILLKGISEFLYFGMTLCGIVAIMLITFLILDRKSAAHVKNYGVLKEVGDENDT